MATIKGLTIEIAGETTKLDKAMSGVNKQSRDLQTELKQVDRLLKLDPKNTELIAQRQKILAESIGTTKSRLDSLKDAEKQVQQQVAEGKASEEQYRALQREIVSTEQKLDSLTKEVKNFGDATAQQLKNAGQAMQEFGSKMASAGTSLIPATAAISAAGAASFKLAADMQDAMGATEQVFGSASEEMKKWAGDLESYYGIAESEALEYGNMMGTMLQNIGGLTEDEAAKQAQTLIELAGDLTAMYGGTTADAVRALTGALKGNNTMLDNYGMAANDAMVKTKAMEMGLISQGKELDLASKQAATLALIMEQSGAAQGQAAKEADGASGSMRTLTTELKNVASSFGDILLPVITPIIQKISEFFTRLKEMDDTTKGIVVTVAALVAGLGPALIIVGNIITAVGAITSALGAAKTAMAAADVATKAATATQWLWNAALTANPIGLIIVAIGLLIAAIAAIVIGIKNLWETDENFRNGVISAWTALVDWFKGVGEWFKTLFTQTIPGMFEFLVDKIKSFLGNIKQFWEDTWNNIVNFFKGIFNTILKIAYAPLNGIISLINGVIDGLNAMIDGLNSIKIEIPDWVPLLGGKEFGINIPIIGKWAPLEVPQYADGTMYHPGGLAVVGERGPELVNLPRGSQVYPTGTAAGTTQHIQVTVQSRDLQDVSRVVRLFEQFVPAVNAGRV